MNSKQIEEMKSGELIQYYNECSQAFNSNDFSVEDKKLFRAELKKLETRIQKFNGLTYIVNRRLGECGIVETGSGKKLYFPFFLMGTCGDDRGVASWSSGREFSTPPKKMDYKWFKSIATKLEENRRFDWDWYSFRNNILKPNREHIKTALKIDDKKMDRFLEDGMVFLNNFDKTWKYEGEDGEGVGLFPNFKNFLECNELKDLEY
jgi:hypothetical protein